MEIQQRSNQSTVGFRVSRDSQGGRELYGTAAVFYDGTPGTEFVLDRGGNGRRKVVERIFPTAFDAVLRDAAGNDTRGLFNHNSDHLLGRRSNGTLRLAKTSRGLDYFI